MITAEDFKSLVVERNGIDIQKRIDQWLKEEVVPEYSVEKNCSYMCVPNWISKSDLIRKLKERGLHVLPATGLYLRVGLQYDHLPL